jgi:hypothetical protein
MGAPLECLPVAAGPKHYQHNFKTCSSHLRLGVNNSLVIVLKMLVSLTAITCNYFLSLSKSVKYIVYPRSVLILSAHPRL